MPGPPPPPPPGCPPPPMPAALFAAPKSKGGSDDRSALLKAIRTQPKLQKVDKSLIHDRSAPLAASCNSSSARGKSSGPSTPVSGSGPPNGLGGLFQGGMPKLKSVHRSGNIAQDTLPSNASNLGGSYGNIQEELRKRLHHDGRTASRGPAPPAPTRNIINEVPSLQSKNEYQVNHNSQLHRKTQSNGNVNTFDSISSNNAPKMSFGKPNLAPKPPVLEKPTPNALANGKLRKSHSVRLPSSPISHTPLQDLNLSHLNHHLGSDMEKFRTLGGSTGHLSQLKSRLINGRPTVPPPSIPTQAAPATPSAKVKPPNHAPPPPPAAASPAPPPPPHRTVPPVPTRAPPAVPTHSAPAPPPRNSSIRSAAPSTNGPSFESRYIFRPASDFPPPARFQNMTKVYTTRQASKQPAPPPPNQIQISSSNRLWESSTC